MPATALSALLCLLGSLALAGCDGDAGPLPAIEWSQVPWSDGTVNVALVRPSEEGVGAPHPVVFALPWGSGSAALVDSFVRSYWLVEPGQRGYYVVAPEVRGTTLVDTADELLPAIFDWMETELDFDADRVALVGASNGGRGLFHAALSQPDRFRALVGLPGSYAGDGAALAVLAGKPIWLLVGELDDSWVRSTEATVAALAGEGIQAEMTVVPNMGHVIGIEPRVLLEWIDEALGR